MGSTHSPKPARHARLCASLFRRHQPCPAPHFCSAVNIAERLSKSEALLNRWSGRWDWVVRAAAWDDEQDGRAREAQIAETVAMNKRHAQMAGVIQTKALEYLSTMLPGQLKPNTAL